MVNNYIKMTFPKYRFIRPQSGRFISTELLMSMDEISDSLS